MIKIKVQLPIEVECPDCGTKNEIDLFQTKDGDIINCRGCGKNIPIKIEGNDIERAKKSLRDLEKTIKDMGNNKRGF